MSNREAADPERDRLDASHGDTSGWKRWGPYMAERAWASVREDYSPDGSAWDYFPHELARSKAYRWGEDGIAGICDRYQVLCLAPAFWNEKDPILKERLFGVTGSEGNHGEDVKEYYFHLDNTPTHSYMRYLYKYPHAEFPYRQLVDSNRARQGTGPEFELLDTGCFAENRYFDIEIEHAKADAEDICVRITATNRGPDPAPLHIIPQLWFRNRWGWDANAWEFPGPAEPVIRVGTDPDGHPALHADDTPLGPVPGLPIRYELGPRVLQATAGAQFLFTNNETNGAAVYGPGNLSRRSHVKDAFHRLLVGGEATAVNSAGTGTKAALHYRFGSVAPGETVVVRLRMSPTGAPGGVAGVDEVICRRRAEADSFYAGIHPPNASADEKMVQRQAIAGLLWTKMVYLFNVHQWLDGDNPDFPPPQSRKNIRNAHWKHLNSMRIMIPAEKWEYPWFAAWDLAFTAIAVAVADPVFAKEQLQLLLLEQFQHPNGQIPAYEWEFSDLNPPVHAWAVWRVFHMDRIRNGKADLPFLERCFHKLLVNFAWWINKVDREGNNVFEGGFLGMDNITVIDRSAPFGDGSVLEQSDGSGYMAMFCLNLMRIALELAKTNHVYEGLATKFFQHYAYIAGAMKCHGDRGYSLWDEEDGFFYDVLRRPDGSFRKFRLRSLVGLIPLFAVERLELSWIEPFRDFHRDFSWLLENRKEMLEGVIHRVESDEGVSFALTVFDENQLRRILARVFDAEEFLSPAGIRSLSRAHLHHPFHHDGTTVIYEPAESDSKLKGGNSNWRGPIWFPINYLLLESLKKLDKAFHGSLKLEVPALPGRQAGFEDLRKLAADRLISVFTLDERGRRPVFGDCPVFQGDPHWRDHVLFYEYFNGDTGAGLGASHQTGWTGLIANLIDEFRS